MWVPIFVLINNRQFVGPCTWTVDYLAGYKGVLEGIPLGVLVIHPVISMREPKKHSRCNDFSWARVGRREREGEGVSVKWVPNNLNIPCSGGNEGDVMLSSLLRRIIERFRRLPCCFPPAC